MCVCVCVCVCVCIVIHRETVSFYQNTTVGLDTLESRSWDRNLAEGNIYIYIYIYIYVCVCVCVLFRFSFNSILMSVCYLMSNLSLSNTVVILFNPSIGNERIHTLCKLIHTKRESKKVTGLRNPLIHGHKWCNGYLTRKRR